MRHCATVWPPPGTVVVGPASFKMFDEDPVPVMHKFAHAGGDHPDPVFVNLDLLGYADLHAVLLAYQSSGIIFVMVTHRDQGGS